MNKLILFSCILTLTVVIFLPVNSILAHPHSGNVMVNDHVHNPQTEIISIDGIIGLETSTLLFHSPESNTLPWAFVEGNIANNVEGYPVIIQIFKNNEAVHFAQTHVEQNDNYEYKFRVLNSDNGHVNKIFEGDYTVKIFKVVYLNQDNLI